MQSEKHLSPERGNKKRESFSDDRDWEVEVRNGHRQHHPRTRSLIAHGSDLAYDPATVTVCLSLFLQINNESG